MGKRQSGGRWGLRLEGVPLVIGAGFVAEVDHKGEREIGDGGFFFALPTHREGRQAFVVRKLVNPALSFLEVGKS